MKPWVRWGCLLLALTCSRDTTLGDTVVAYRLTVNAAQGQTLRDAVSSESLAYGLWKNSGFDQAWGSIAPAQAIEGTVTLTAGSSIGSMNLPYYLSLPILPQAPAAGSYLGSLAVTLAYDNGVASLVGSSQDSATLAVTVDPACSLSAPPSLQLAYVSMQATEASTTSSFSVSCNTAYSLSLEPAQGTLLGLDYGLTLDAYGGVYDTLTHWHVITATVAARQAGACLPACQGSRQHLVVVSY